MNEKKYLEIKNELVDIIHCAFNDWDDYSEECYEKDESPVEDVEDFVADAIIKAGYVKLNATDTNDGSKSGDCKNYNDHVNKMAKTIYSSLRNDTMSRALASLLCGEGYRKQIEGEWIKVAAYNDGVLNTVKCSACECYQPVGCWDYHKYCPHCGAKMRRGSEMPYEISKDKVEKHFEYVKIEDIVGLDEGKSIGEIFAEELDKMIANDIADVFKKYFPHIEIDYKKVLRLARAVIAEESKGGE
jgi:hypothetical protein